MSTWNVRVTTLPTLLWLLPSAGAAPYPTAANCSDVDQDIMSNLTSCQSFPNRRIDFWVSQPDYRGTWDIIQYPQVTADEMWDKSKQDTVTKRITSFQICYLVLQCIGRAVQHLEITTLELNALAIVVCSLMTSFTWLHKPSSVRTPITIHSTSTLTQGTAYDTPLASKRRYRCVANHA